MALLDLTDAQGARYAEHRADGRQNVGSVGKLVVALALFQALADTWPEVERATRKVLRETTGHRGRLLPDRPPHGPLLRPRHQDARAPDDPDRGPGLALRVPRLDALPQLELGGGHGHARSDARPPVRHGVPRPGEAEIRRFFKETPVAERTALFERTFLEPVTRNGLSLELLKQGSFFTHRRQADRARRGRELRLAPASSRSTWCASRRDGSWTSSRAGRSSGSST